MKTTPVTSIAIEVKEAPTVRPVSVKAKGYEDFYAPQDVEKGSIIFAWSVIGLTSTLLVAGFGFFAYAVTRLP